MGMNISIAFIDRTFLLRALYNYLMFSGTVMYGNMHSNVLLKVQCTPYKIVLQMHVLLELL